MTLEERIELAARALDSGEEWGDPNADGKAQSALRAAFPELFSTPPTAWLAPMEATDVMLDRANMDIGMLEDEVTADLYRAMRDAHLNLDTPTRRE